jgi:alpha-1,6-mannosyltransferase
VLSVTRVIGLGVAFGMGVWLLLRSDRIGALRAMGLTLLLVVALGPVVQPWYLSWGLVLLAPVATGRVRTLIIVSSIASAFIGLPAGRQLTSDLFSADPLTVALALLGCLAVLTVPLTSVDRGRLVPPWRRRGRGPDRQLGEPAPALDYAT